jgi:outer membrane protein OmpA-like peptidoglycan-associated protein
MKYCILYLFLIFLIPTVYAQNGLEKLETVNSQSDDQNPLLSPDGNTLYFTRIRHAENVGGVKDPGDIWFSQKQEDGSWSVATNLTELNNAYLNNIIGFAENGEKVYLSGHYLPGGNKPTTQGISVARKSGDGWSSPQSLKIPYFYNKSEHQSGSIHASGQVMILSLQSYDSRGAEDLYVLFKQSDGSWSEPKNLGTDINTEYQEMTPFLAQDGKTLFFASNGYEGFGSRDIFSSVRLDESWKKWSNPRNLGARVNTEGTELYYNLSPDGEYAYLSSTQNSDGLGDINRVPINSDEEDIIEEPVALTNVEDADDMDIAEPELEEEEETQMPEIAEVSPVEEAEKVVSIRGVITNEKTSEPVKATVILASLKKDTSDSLRIEASSEGTYNLEVDPEDDYEIFVESAGYMRKRNKLLLSQQAPIDNSDVVVRNFSLTPIEVGTTVNLESVLFDRGTAEMLSGSTETLDEVVKFLSDNPAIEIEVSGHTDNRGRADLNQILSQERAEAVKRYMVDQGINSARIQEKGYGGTRPIASNAIEEERRKNRRVEFTIIKK